MYYKTDEHTIKPIPIKLHVIHHNHKEVIQFDLNGNKIKEYESVKDAAADNNVHVAGISTCCRGELETSYGYIWKYKKNIGDVNNIEPAEKKAPARAKRIAKYDINSGEKLQEYESATVAEKEHNVSRRSICDACMGKSKTCGGFVWKYI